MRAFQTRTSGEHFDAACRGLLSGVMQEVGASTAPEHLNLGEGYREGGRCHGQGSEDYALVELEFRNCATAESKPKSGSSTKKAERNDKKWEERPKIPVTCFGRGEGSYTLRQCRKGKSRGSQRWWEG